MSYDKKDDDIKAFGRWALPEPMYDSWSTVDHILHLAVAQEPEFYSVEGVRIWLEGKEISRAVSEFKLKADANDERSIMRCTLTFAVRLVPPPEGDE